MKKRAVRGTVGYRIHIESHMHLGSGEKKKNAYTGIDWPSSHGSCSYVWIIHGDNYLAPPGMLSATRAHVTEMPVQGEMVIHINTYTYWLQFSLVL